MLTLNPDEDLFPGEVDLNEDLELASSPQTRELVAPSSIKELENASSKELEKASEKDLKKAASKDLEKASSKDLEKVSSNQVRLKTINPNQRCT